MASEPVEDARSEKYIDAKESASIPHGETSFLQLMNSVDLKAFDFQYDMSFKKTGKCLIFYHTAYSPDSFKKKFGARKSGYEDQEMMERLFKDLQFDTQTFKNNTYEEIMGNLDKAIQIGFDDYSCFVCCITTHGTEGGVLLAYEKEYNISEIWALFRPDNCPSLSGKPKIFIIQACRGNNRNYGQKVYFREMTDSGSTEDLIDLASPSEASHMTLIPAYTDFLTAYSTYEGFYAFGNEQTGSYFIKVLCEELKEKHCSCDLLQILTLVNRRIAYEILSRNKDPQKNNLKQMPCFYSTLRKLVKFP